VKQSHHTITDGRMHLAAGSTEDDPRWVFTTAFYPRKVMSYPDAIHCLVALRKANPGRVYEVLEWGSEMEAKMVRD